MQSPVYGRHGIDIKATYLKYSASAQDLLAVHAILGCDFVAATYGVGKTTAVNVASKGHRLDLLGDLTTDFMQVEKQATEFVAACNVLNNARLDRV